MSDDVNATRDRTEDDDLLGELRALARRIDPVPPDALAAARSAIAWRTIDAELAALTADTSVDDERLALVRGTGAPTLLSFDAAGLLVEVEVAEVGGRRRLLGQLVPPQPGVVEVRHGGAPITVDADEIGRFAADNVAPGPVSLRCRGTDGPVVETDWFLV